MQVTEDYLKRFSTQIRGFPAEIPLNGYEQPAAHAIGIDDPDGTYLSVTYRDDYETPYDALPGADKRETFVIPKRGPETVGSIGYRFAGLITMDDLRSWYRRKFELDSEA
jgi:hypothetical protein